MPKIAPSILNADFRSLGQQIEEAERGGADYVHVDVMDGHFVPAISLGPQIVEAVRGCTSLPIDVHLMIESPERFLDDFARAGASILTVHQEAVAHLHSAVSAVHQLNLRAGVALNPATPLVTVEEILGELELLLVMTVNPGLGGQPLIESMVDKVERARQMLDQRAAPAELEVDGGVTVENIGRLARAGATVFVAGTSVFRGGCAVEANVRALREALGVLR